MTISPIRNDKDEIINFVSVSEDVTADKERNLRLEFLANHDPLTELANRRYFLTKLKQAIKRRRRNHVSFVLATLDIDHFDIINQRFGQDIGDLILKELADRLVHSVRTTALLHVLAATNFLFFFMMLIPLKRQKMSPKKCIWRVNNLIEWAKLKLLSQQV